MDDKTLEQMLVFEALEASKPDNPDHYKVYFEMFNYLSIAGTPSQKNLAYKSLYFYNMAKEIQKLDKK